MSKNSLFATVKLFRHILYTIIFGYLLVMGGFIATKVLITDQIGSFQSIVHNLFQHPFQVNGAAREMRHEVSLIRNDMLLALALQNPRQLSGLRERIHSIDLSLDQRFHIIDANFLGDRSTVSDIQQSMANWKMARYKLLTLLERERYSDAKKYIHATSSKLFEEVNIKLDAVIQYSSKKALFLANKSEKESSIAHTLFLLLLGGLAAITLLAAVLTITMVIRQLHKSERRISQEQKHFRSMFNLAPIPLLLVTDKGKIVKANSAVEQHFGYKPEALLDQSINLLIPERYRDAHGSYMSVFLDNKTASTDMAADRELFGIIKSGDEAPIEVQLSRIEMAGETFVLAAISNITERKNLEASLIEERNRAEQASQSKSSFLANMSHEIRTPLNAILGLTHLVLDTPLQAEQRDHLTKAFRSSQALLSILNDILDYSKIESGHMHIEHAEFNLEEVLKQLSDLFMPLIEEKHIELFFKLNALKTNLMIGDSLHLGQILNNLLSNAIKFTEQGEILIKVNELQRKESEVLLQFTVCDTGIGMNDEQLSHLFHSFSQADNTIRRKFGGTGLGLAISKQLVELMEGEISVTSEPGVGSTFSFTIALGIGQLLPESIIERSTLKHMRVLIVDDQETSLSVLRGYLESWRFDVVTASSGEKALALIAQNEDKKHCFDLIMLDWKMPGMNGLQLAHAIAETSSSHHKQRPMMIMATGYEMEDVKRESDASLLDAVLIKPIIPSSLFDTIMNITTSGERHTSLLLADIPNIGKASRAIRNANILLVEDNEINQVVATETLKRIGFQVVIANHGVEAITLIQQQQFDVVLMDIHMPVMDGFEATRQIRLLPQGKKIPIIALSAAAMQEDIKLALEAGMNAHLAKPVDAPALISILEKYITLGDRNALKPMETPDKMAVATLPDALPGFELAKAIERLGGDQALLVKLLNHFADEHQSTQQELHQLLANHQHKEAAQLLHGLSGAAINLGAKQLADAAKELEHELKRGVLDPQWDDFAKVLTVNLAMIDQHIKTPETLVTKAIEVDPQELILELQALASKLKVYDVIDPNALTSIFSKLSGTVRKGLLQQLSNQIDTYDCSAAVLTLDDILALLKENR
ncbi:MAG: response regulator [Mariprofundus sp.]|nr:response regulator [Mariprofundus sp.]